MYLIGFLGSTRVLEGATEGLLVWLRNGVSLFYSLAWVFSLFF